MVNTLFHSLSPSDDIGQGAVDTLRPSEIGHAAAYEAYRGWIHNSSMYASFGDDDYRQREALAGLAIGEGPVRCRASNASYSLFHSYSSSGANKAPSGPF